MSKIIIPEDHQKYLQREFPMGSGTVSGTDILIITQALVRCLIYICTHPWALRALRHRAYISGNALLPVL